MSGDIEQEYFADGVADDIITELARVRSLFVIARNSSFAYKARAVDVRQIARELGVRYILEGSVRRGAERLRISAQLVDAETGNHCGPTDTIVRCRTCSRSRMRSPTVARPSARRSQR